MRRIGSFVAITACCATLMTTGVRPAAAAGGVSMSVSKSTILVGKKEHFTGHVSSGGKRRIVLQKKAGSSWRSLIVRHTDSNGDYKFAFIPASPGHPTFRMVATTSKGKITATSPSARVTVLQWHYLYDLNTVAGYLPRGSVDINGKTYLRSLYEPSDYKNNAGDSVYAEYNLSRKCTSFKATFGLVDDSDPSTPVNFEVAADGNLLYTTTQSLGESVTSVVDISGHLRLHLEYVVTADGPGNNGLHPAFGNAEILCSF